MSQIRDKGPGAWGMKDTNPSQPTHAWSEGERVLTPQQKGEGYTIRPDGSLWHPDNFLGSGKRADHYFTDLGERITWPLESVGIPPWGTYLLLLGGSYFIWRRM
jgi:hypothetical protein